MDTTGGTPRIPFTLGTATKHAAYHSGSGTTALVFRYTVAAGDADSDGITVAQNALALNGGTIDDGSSNAATLDHAALAASADHTVDTVRPTLSSAAVSGTALTLTFSEALGAASSLANSAFTVKKTAGGTENDGLPEGGTSPAISGTAVTLTLAAAVTATDTAVKVSYAVPASGDDNKIVDAAGNPAAAFTDSAVTNATGPAVTAAGGVLVGPLRRSATRLRSEGDVQRGGDGGRRPGARRASRSPWARRPSTRPTTRAAARRRWCSATRWRRATRTATASRSRRTRWRSTAGPSTTDPRTRRRSTHAALAASADHTVDTVRPTLSSAAVSGTTLTLTFNEALGAAGEPRQLGVHGEEDPGRGHRGDGLPEGRHAARDQRHRP